METQNCFSTFCKTYKSGGPTKSAPFFEGYAFEDRLVFSTSEAVEKLLQTMDPDNPPSGNFTAVLQRPEGVVFTADWLGLSQLYLYAAKGVTIVSNNLVRIVAAVREATGKSPAINWPALHRFAVFDTPFTHATPYEGINCVPFDSYVVVNEQGATVKKRFRFSDVSAERGNTALYRSLIEQAAAEMSANAEAVIKSFSTDRPVVTSLSGGIDSRIMLASLVATGRHKDIGHYTYGSTIDSREAASLRNLLGLNFHQIGEVRLLPAAKRSPQAFRDVGVQRRISPNAFMSPIREVFMNGGCGETFRGFYSKMIQGFDYSIGLNPLQELLVRKGRSKYLHSEAISTVKDAIVAEYGDIMDESPMTRLDLLYPTFRNRFHFGLGGRARARSALVISPLCSPSALKASLVLPAEERATNRVAYDLIGLLAPELQDFEVSGQPWNPLFANRESRPLPKAEVEVHSRSVAFGEDEKRAMAKIALSLLNKLTREHSALAKEVKERGYKLPKIRRGATGQEEMPVSEIVRHAQILSAILETEKPLARKARSRKYSFPSFTFFSKFIKFFTGKR